MTQYQETDSSGGIKAMNRPLLPSEIQKVEIKLGTTVRPFRVVSMFSGCGGMDLGFKGGFEFLGKKYQKNNVNIIWANDLNEAACRTYKKNVGTEIRSGDFYGHKDTLPKCGEVDILIGGFPCQDISVNGKGAGADGARSGLYRAMVETIQELRPKVFVAENVKGLLMRHNKASLDRIMADFGSLGYSISLNLYHAADYGVPQSRERVFIVGTAPGLPDFTPPKPTHTSDEWITAKQAIDDLRELPEDAATSHIWSRAKRSGEQGNRKLKSDRVAYTIRAECHGNIQYHYQLRRRISMREAARIQSFPDNFLFDAKLRETERQIGNAVPPVLAWHIARGVRKVLQGQ